MNSLSNVQIAMLALGLIAVVVFLIRWMWASDADDIEVNNWRCGTFPECKGFKGCERCAFRYDDDGPRMGMGGAC